jgi:hypothetical protein
VRQRAGWRLYSAVAIGRELIGTVPDDITCEPGHGRTNRWTTAIDDGIGLPYGHLTGSHPP